MKLLRNEAFTKSGSVEVVMESTADVYMLYNLVDAEDRIKTLTCRKIALDSAGTQKKMTLLMVVRVEEKTLDVGSEKMYCKGKTVSEHEHVKKGSYHTLDLEVGTRLTIYKDSWTEMSMDLLKKMQRNSFDLFFVILHEKTITILSLSHGFINKTHRITIKNKSYKPVFEYLENTILGAKKVVVVTFKDDRKVFSTQLADTKGMSQHIKLFCDVQLDDDMKNLTGLKVVEAVFTTQRHLEKLSKTGLEDEVYQMELFVRNFHKSPGLVCIGIEELEEAINYGAVKNVLMTYEKYRKLNSECMQRVEMVFNQIKGIGGATFMVPEMHLIGQKLKELGGLVANLKFEYRNM